ncbi:hypothetical protein DFJ77DRAFT_231293 [Powellomyces hirtus]|nr:hypothetical protein DFJ77DRAFT_231293 [Powellomyces hirtus]
MSHQPKTTIHVTNITKDKATLKRMFQDMNGFRRISFHQDYCFVCFEDLSYATDAIDEIHSQTDMLAAYAKHGVASTTTPTIAVQPNPILYVSLFSYFTESELTRIFRTYEGFDSCRFFPSHALVRFKDMECSKIALEDLNSTTNLFANYSTKGAKQGSGRSRRGTSGSVPATSPGVTVPNSTNSEAIIATAQAPTLSIASQPEKEPSDSASRREQAGAVTVTGSGHPKKTIHVTNIDNDKAGILQLFSKYEGFRRVAFYADYCFVCFADTRTASKAIEELLFKTKMKANFAKADFIPHLIPASAIGHPNYIIRVSDYPSNTSEHDLVRVLQRYEGFSDVHFYHASCLVYYADQACARRALEGLNANTNFTAIYSKKGINSRSRGSNAPASRSSRATQQTNANSTLSPTITSTQASIAVTTTGSTPLVNPSSQSSPNSSGTPEDESSSSPRGTPSPGPDPPSKANRLDDEQEDEEPGEEETGRSFETVAAQEGSALPASMFIQPDMVNDTALAVAAELLDGIDVNGQSLNPASSDTTVPSFPVSLSDGSNSVPESDVESSDVLHEHVSHHMHSQSREISQLDQHQGRSTLPSQVHKHLHFATFTQQHFHMTPQPSHQPNALSREASLSATGGVEPFTSALTTRRHHVNNSSNTVSSATLPYSVAAASNGGQQELPLHLATDPTPTSSPYESLLLEKAGIENQLIAAKSFIDDLFAQYLHLEQENRMLRQSHHHQQLQLPHASFPQAQRHHGYHVPMAPANVADGDVYFSMRNPSHISNHVAPLASTTSSSQPISAGTPSDQTPMSAPPSLSSVNPNKAILVNATLANAATATAPPSGANAVGVRLATVPNAPRIDSHIPSTSLPKPLQLDPTVCLNPSVQQASGSVWPQQEHTPPPQPQPQTAQPQQQQHQQQHQQQQEHQLHHYHMQYPLRHSYNERYNAQHHPAELADGNGTNEAHALRREIARLREQLHTRNLEYERLDAAHKSCGVLQGLLAMCE